MSGAPEHDSVANCSDCGRFGAYVFESEHLCLDCYQERGSCCAAREAGADDGQCVSLTVARQRRPEVAVHLEALTELRLNPNCCYQACAGCSSIRRLRAFRGRYPDDWFSRLRGSARLLRAAEIHE